MKPVICIITAVLLFAAAKPALAQNRYTITPDLAGNGIKIPDDYSGIAYEISEIVPKLNGKYYFYPNNKALVQLYKTLGLKTIRIGGNTADWGDFKFPEKADVDSLFLFARAAGIKVNYTLKLKNGSMVANTAIAKYIYEHYRNELQCFAIGNEPNEFIHDYKDYAAQWQPYRDTLAKLLPGVKFCGPNNTTNATTWPALFLNQFGGNNDLAFLAVHDYPGNSAYSVKDAASGVNEMLSTEWLKRYDKFDKVYGISTSKLPFQLEEINSFYNGGARHVSDTYASALWSVDYMYWWAMHHLGGINFQNGDSVASGSKLTPCKYAAFVTQGNGYFARPSAYGIKMFDIAGHGTLLPTAVVNNNAPAVPQDSLSLRAYSVLAADGSMNITILNKDHQTGNNAEVMLPVGGKYKHCKLMYLRSPDGTASAESGITLGGLAIDESGSWNGTWTPEETENHTVVYRIILKPTEAVIVKLSK